MTYAIRFRSSAGARDRGQSAGWVTGIEGTVLTYGSKKRAKAALRWAVEQASPGEWYEIEEYDDDQDV